MECPKTQCTLNESTTCGYDTNGHKHYFSLPNSEKNLAKFLNDAEMINATTGMLYYKQVICSVLNMYAF